MQYCKKCIQPDTRPGIQFDSEGVCPPCRFAENHEKIDWTARRQELEEIADFGRKHNVSGYDCIVAVSGGKDSLRQALYLRDELGLNPLLVSCVYPPEHQTERGARNVANLISLGFDFIGASPNPQVWKKMMREGFLRYGNFLKSSEMALYASTPKVAISYHIPLICFGENPVIALGALEVRSTTGDANRIKHSYTLKGGTDSVKTKDIRDQDLYWYRYPSDDEMEWAKLKLFYLGYYLKDFTRFYNGDFAQKHGLEIRTDPPEDIGDNYGFEALDDDFVIVNQMLKYIKYGFGKVTDQVCEAIRLKMMTRDQAIDLALKYDGKCANRYVKKFCNFLEISESQFWEVANRFRNKEIFEEVGKGEWRLKTRL